MYVICKSDDEYSLLVSESLNFPMKVKNVFEAEDDDAALLLVEVGEK